MFFYHLLAQKRGRHRREPFRVLAQCVKRAWEVGGWGRGCRERFEVGTKRNHLIITGKSLFGGGTGAFSWAPSRASLVLDTGVVVI